MITHNIEIDKEKLTTLKVSGALMMICAKAIAIADYVGLIFNLKSIQLRYSGEAGLMCQASFTLEFETISGVVLKQDFQLVNVKEAPGADVIAGHVIGSVCRDIIINHSKKNKDETRFIKK